MSKQPIHNLFETLNEKQREAAKHVSGPLLVIAGAGSGKTRTLAHRIAYLILNGHLDKDKKVLAITFTNKAAGEMKRRIRSLLKNKNIGNLNALLFAGTFHSFGAKTLRSTAKYVQRSSNYSIYDEKDSLSLVKTLCKRLRLNKDRAHPSAVRREISKIKNEVLEWKEYEKNASSYLEKSVCRVYKKYEEALIEQNAFDFDDLIEKPVRIFRKHKEALVHFQNQYQYILIDEYQDTNAAQYHLVKLLGWPHKNVCVVGDDAQSIYGWRGADFRNFLFFDKDWPKTKTVKLEQNYRSTKNILKAADGIIEKNALQKKKNLWTDNEAGPPVYVVEAKDERQEAWYIIEQIKELIDEGYSPNEIAIFYRTNAQSRAIEEVFLDAGLPYVIVGSVRFYDRMEIKDVLAYLRIIANPKDHAALERIITVPRKGYSKNRLRKLNYSLEPVPEFQELLENLRELAKTTPASTLITKLLKKINYLKYLEKRFSDANQRWENVMELLTLAQQFDEEYDPPDALRMFLESAHLMQSSEISEAPDGSLSFENEPQKSSVQLMTVHAAKGLEFDVVFMAGCEEGLIPHSRSLAEKESLEEERRIMYVALTRARKELFLCFAKRRRIFGKKSYTSPSQFLYEIPPEATEFLSMISERDSLEGEEDWMEWDEEDWIEY